MSLADRVMRWFGYVPAEHYYEAVRMLSHGIEWQTLHALNPSAIRWDDEPETKTIVVSADFNRGIPCS